MPSSRQDPVAQESSSLSNLWHRWKMFAKRLGDFQARVVLSLFYFLLLPPLAVAVKFLSDPLRLQAKGNSFWLSRSSPQGTNLEDSRRQF